MRLGDQTPSLTPRRDDDQADETARARGADPDRRALLAQNNRAAPPQLAFKVVDDFFQIPDTIWMAEAVGVALNSKGNIFILNRGNHPLLEFTPAGSSCDRSARALPIFHAAHSVRFDARGQHVGGRLRATTSS